MSGPPPTSSQDLMSAAYPPAARSGSVSAAGPAQAVNARCFNGWEIGETLTSKGFVVVKELGQGSYATVFQIKSLTTNEDFALKVLEKAQILRLDKAKTVFVEKAVLHKLNHFNIIKLFSTFSDNLYLYMVLEYADGGELFHQIKRASRVEYHHAQFYTAEILLALEYLHTQGIIHRDLKPENLLLSGDGHIKLSDFGTAKIKDNDAPDARPTFCGTPEYVSPEVLSDKPGTEASDLWALGCIVYQLLTGVVPFRAPTEYFLFQKITKDPAPDYTFPADFPEHAKDFVQKLLIKEPTHRLGAGGNYHLLKAHPFLSALDFSNLHSQMPPPLNLRSGSTIDDPSRRASNAVLATSESTATTADRRVSAAPPSPMVAETAQWAQFLMPGEQVVFTTRVQKRRGLFARKRQLILTSFPRLLYVDNKKMVYKGEIPWSEQLTCKQKASNASVFDIVTPNRTYHMEELTGRAKEWMDAIELAKQQSFGPK